MSIGLHKYLLLTVCILGIIGGGLLCLGLSALILTLLLPQLETGWPGLVTRIVASASFSFGAVYFGHNAPHWFSALVPARCPDCGAGVRLNPEAFGKEKAKYDYSCINCDKTF